MRLDASKQYSIVTPKLETRALALLRQCLCLLDINKGIKSTLVVYSDRNHPVSGGFTCGLAIVVILT